MTLFMIALAHEFNRPASSRFFAVDPENLAHKAQPTAVDEARQRLVFAGFVNVVPVEIVTGDVAFTTRHAADALLQFVQAGNVLLAVAFDLAGGLARDGGFVFLGHACF